ncbi:hypothetical protein DXG01_005694 [Tephrocybe rancida]|nr:hypothetical protein DXG01_005694 [Tephrocybe rancida]
MKLLIRKAATLDLIGVHILTYWKMQKNDKEILAILRQKHIDHTQYGLGLTRFREMREQMGLIQARKAAHNVESIRDTMCELRLHYPKAGTREMISLLFHEHNMSVPNVVISYFAIFEPELVEERKAHRLKRKEFWAAGVNDIVAVNQHDKWKYKFGLALHTGIEPMAGRIQWIKVWWTNSNPRLILSYYLDEVQESGKVMPLVSQSDPGSENFGIANGHTLLRHWHDPSLTGTLQHWWMREKKNIKPEISWSQMRCRFTPGFKDLLDFGVNQGWYSPENYLEAMVFRWVFIPLLQRELDAYRDRINNSKKRADKNKVLPHGAPNDIYTNPENFGVLDFKASTIHVEHQAIDYVRSLYAPPNHPVFELVPLTFGTYATQFYQTLGQPVITRNNVWDVYLDILNMFNQLDDICEADHAEWYRVASLSWSPDTEDEPLELLDGLCDLPNGMDSIREDGSYYMGGVNGGEGLDGDQWNRMEEMAAQDKPEMQSNPHNPQDPQPELVVDFTDDEDEVKW